ncbi:MAG: TadE/TadG family type IV pilus assembly protein [Pacificimonas sp.]|nr:TadE/TadG family type IV pilus assembly protein [Pacificimonas sp.]
MIRALSQFRRFRRDERGSYVVEWGFLAVPLIGLMVSSIEFGFQSYANARMEGTLRQVSRLSGTGRIVGDTSLCATPDACTDTEVKEAMRAFVEDELDDLPNARVAINVLSYSDFTSVGDPELIERGVGNETETGNPVNGDCWIEVNNNDSWDSDIGLTGTGNSEDVVYFEVEVRYDRIFGLSAALSGSDQAVLTSTTTIRNEPYGNAAELPKKRICMDPADGALTITQID